LLYDISKEDIMDELDAMEVIKTDLKSMNLDKTLLEKLLESVFIND